MSDDAPGETARGPLSPDDRAHTIGDEIRRLANRHPERLAVIASGFEPLSYGRLLAQIDDVRDQLLKAGFDRHARIAISLPNGPLAALAITATMCSAVAVPLDPRLTAAEVENRFELLRPSAVLLLSGEESPARGVAEKTGVPVVDVVVADGGPPKLDLITPSGKNPATAEPVSPDATAFILQTSGTAATPKLVPFSHANMLATASRVRGWFDLNPGDRCLSISSAHYSHGLKVTVLAPLLSGGSVAFPENPTMVDLVEWFGDLAPTWYSAGPTQHLAVSEKLRTNPETNPSHRIRLAVSGGGPLPEAVRENLESALEAPILEHYGSSEAGQISANLSKPGKSKPGTCGIPPEGILRIVDENGDAVGPGDEGSIQVGGPTLIAGYYNAPELNRASFVNGWFQTGDVGVIDEEGFLSLRGRASDIINKGGEKVGAAEVEAVMRSHPAVLEAAAFAVPHPRLGQDIAAAVVLKGDFALSARELRSFLSSKLTWFKIPRRIDFVDELPKGATGKILKRKLVERTGDSADEID